MTDPLKYSINPDDMLNEIEATKTVVTELAVKLSKLIVYVQRTGNRAELHAAGLDPASIDETLQDLMTKP